MSIRQLLLASFLLIILLASGQALMGMRSTNQVGGLVTEMYDGPLTGISFARAAQTKFADALRHMMAAVRLSQQFGSSADREPIDAAFQAFVEDLEVAAERINGAGMHEQVDTVLADAKAWKAEGDKLLGGMPDGTVVTEIPTAAVLEQQGEKIYQALDLIVEEAAATGYAFSMNAREIVAQIEKVELAIIGVFVVVSLALALVISARLTGRIRLAMATARRVADGDLEQDVVVKGRDECGQLLAALGEMQKSLRNRRDLDVKESESKEREKAEAESQRRQLEGWITEFESEVASVMNPVRDAIAQMQEMSDRVVALSRDTGTKTRDVAASTLQASDNVQNVAASSEELAASVAEIANRVGDAGRSANEAVAEAERTNETVASLASAAEQIGDIVSLIQNIAAQTNLLALNATIEAARAGEAGKGFAVVASEVKSLATQTAKATEEITTQIETMRGASDQATKAIAQIGDMILKINDQTTTISSAVEEQNASTSGIARDVKLAADGTSQVSMTLNSVSDMSDEAEKMAGALAETSTNVSDRSQDLVRSIEGFLSRIRAA